MKDAHELTERNDRTYTYYLTILPFNQKYGWFVGGDDSGEGPVHKRCVWKHIAVITVFGFRCWEDAGMSSASFLPTFWNPINLIFILHSVLLPHYSLFIIRLAIQCNYINPLLLLWRFNVAGFCRHPSCHSTCWKYLSSMTLLSSQLSC